MMKGFAENKIRSGETRETLQETGYKTGISSDTTLLSGEGKTIYITSSEDTSLQKEGFRIKAVHAGLRVEGGDASGLCTGPWKSRTGSRNPGK